ncbi:MAG: carboxypeptidase regulatory-like domain-containing protein, partial [Prevotella sp.]|nr:carboxypeptidase regulatory-like domain-containing protein [Prevotella sp.]
MKRLILLLLIAHLSLSGAVAQKRITREYNNVSFSEALRQLNVESEKYEINFLYNELEDFRITTTVRRKTLPDAIRQMIGFYPIRMSIDSTEITVECVQKADTRYKGMVIDESGRPIAYANVALLNSADSALLNGGVSNESGYFAIPASSNLFPNGAAEPVLLKISFVGYKTVYKRCENPEIGTIQMQPAQYTIKGVTVDGTRIMNYVDKSVHTFSPEQIKKARHVCDLLEFVEDLKIDPVSNKIKQINGGDVKILLNGVTASEIDLKGIPANKILKVEYYNIPPARYADAGVVVNVITKEAETGYGVGVEGRTAFTTGFTDDHVYYNFTSGNHQLGLSYLFNLREYTKRFSEHTYDYLLNGRQTQYKNTQRDKFGYT